MTFFQRPGFTKLLLVAAGATITLLLFEAGLRIAGFSYQAIPRLQFGWPDPSTLQNAYAPDADLLWVPRNYASRLEQARELSPAVIFLGDSCTEFGTYPARTLEILAKTRPDLSSGVQLGVGGWSTEQGLAQLRRDVLPIRPRVVVLYFGWNDHWVALGPPDAEIRRAPLLRTISVHCRLLQLLEKAQSTFAPPLSRRPNRVELPRYLSNLENMVRISREAGVRLVLVTAPSNHIPGREPSYLAIRHLRRLSDLVPLHQAYVEATRRAASETGATLCDAAWKFRFLVPPPERYFRQDGIHLTEEGDREMARLVSECIDVALPLSPAGAPPSPRER
jgi:lysophospholipase L1-like esterase